MESKYTIPIPKVHIVTNLGEGWIIPKFVKNLQEQTGWSVGLELDLNAEINYFYPYYYYKQCDTLTAAFFTHREEHPDFEHRRDQWDKAAKEVSLRLVLSYFYSHILEPYGLTEVTTLPVDSLPANWSEPKKYVLGVCGRNYPSQRKGRKLLKQLLEHPISKHFEIRFAGYGWGDLGPSKEYKDKDMDKFYKQLDFYLCTSTVEGGPMSILEAEILGVPTIAPRGVGFCEDFASYLYEKSNLHSLVQVLEKLVVPRFKLSDYNKKTWAIQHIDIFRKLVDKRIG